MLRRLDPWLLAILGVSLVLCLAHLGWGLPNGNDSWAADAMGPLTVLNVGRRQLFGWETGWFWFKYPFGYPLMLLLAYAPYLALVWLTGGLGRPAAEYPYGLSDPEGVVHVLALIGRGVNVAFVVGTVAATYAIGRELLGQRSGRLAAWFTATAYPLVYYAHTTNQDAAYLFWLTLALWGTVAGTFARHPRPLWVMGFAAGMAMATKEQGFAFLLGLPIVLVIAGYRRGDPARGRFARLWRAAWNPGTRGGAAIAIATWLVAGNAIFNPRGFLNRLSDLSGNPVPGISARITPVEFSLFKGFPKEWAYVTDFVDVVASTFGTPLFVVSLAGLVYLALRRPHVALCLIVPFAAYYLLSLRTHHVLTLRYTLPVVPIFAVAGAAVCVAALRHRFPGALLVVSLLAVLGLGRAVELVALLRDDPRYAAEAWMEQHLPAKASVEIYQKPVYLPRLPRHDVHEVPLEERSIAGIEERQPLAIVLSSASRKTITHFWTKDWREGDGSLLTEIPAASEMLRALEGGGLPYREVARFEREPWLLRLRITSVAPTIRVFRRAP